MKIYTKTGDGGETGLVGGGRVAKNSARMDAIGTVDELNAVLGVARASAPGSGLDADLATLQSWLFDLGAELASTDDSKRPYAALEESHIGWIEASIDRLTEGLEPLRNFILPGGSLLAANLHHARAVARRAERITLALHEEAPLRAEVRTFLNRLSDWLFTAARAANVEAGVPDVPWQKIQS